MQVEVTLWMSPIPAVPGSGLRMKPIAAAIHVGYNNYQALGQAVVVPTALAAIHLLHVTQALSHSCSYRYYSSVH